MKFRDAVKYLRSELGLTQMELAMGLNINAITVGRWENGRTLPTRSITTALLEFARSKGASDNCLEMLTRSITAAAKEKLELSGEGLFAVEHEALRQLIDGASFAVCVCDMQTDEMLYFNRKASELLGADDCEVGRKCYECLMHRDAPCESCHKAELVEDEFRSYDVRRDADGAQFSVQGKLIRWNGRRAQVKYIFADGASAKGQLPEAEMTTERLKTIFENINGGVSVVVFGDDGTVHIAYANERYYKLFGYTKEQYLTELKDSHDTVHPEDYEKTAAAIAKVKETKQADSFRYRIIKRDKSIVDIRCNSSVTTVDGVSGYALISVLTDITEAVRLEQQAIVTSQQLAAQHEQISALLNDTPSGIAIIEVDPEDISGTLHTTYFNDRFFSFSGYNREEYTALLKNNEMAFVFAEDAPALLGNTRKICEGEPGISVDTLVRCHTKSGDFRWLLLTGQLAEKRGDICVINVALLDITQRQQAVDRQRINEEMLRIAAETDKRAIIIYDIKNSVCRVESRMLFSVGFGESVENVPQSLIDRGIAAPDSVDELCAMFSRIRNGEQRVRASLQLRSGTDKYEWFECNCTTVFDSEGFADHAVLVLHNITEQRVKEAVFKKWQQSIDARPPESYTLFRCNLSRETGIEERNGSLLNISFPPEAASFNSRTKIYAEEYVYPDDREEYIRLLDSDSLLTMFYRGEHSAVLDYREVDDNGQSVWRRLTVETVEYPDCADVQAFLLFEDIDDEKKSEIAARELAESDPLTGALNRGAFAEKVNETIDANANLNCALIMLDMDGFKQLNDTFGHAAGDQALQEVVSVLRSFARSGDFVCRLGGDEFMVWLRDVPYDAVIGKITQQMCEHIRKAYSKEVLLSASAGVAVYPRDGHSYDELYKSADKALYRVKESDKGSYAFYSVIGEEQTQELTKALSEVRASPQSPYGVKRRMLIVDDNEINRMMLKSIFKDEYAIETAKNGAEAMLRLRHFGVSISVVLLDLVMPGIDGFAVLKKMRSDVDLRTIPVIVVTGDEEHATLLKAFELGAAEYVVKPVDTDIIRMRVKAVISKAESERLRAQNSYLMLQRDEEVKYRTVLESTGTVVVEYDWRNHVFIYDSEISKHIAGNYDHRGLWQVFLSDMVADSADVKSIQERLMCLAGNRGQSQDSRLVKLKTPEGERHWFRISMYKNVDDFGLAEKLIITFNDVHNEVLANDRLLFQATRDELTGLYNRAGFLEKAAELIALREPGYYVMSCVDVEKFQVINDQYGTERGDEVLRHIAACVGGFVQAHKGICGRYAADKFAVLYPARLKNTKELEDNHREVSTPTCIPRPLRLRIGRCLVNDTSLPISALFDRAAMAEALAKGRYDTNVIDYDDSMRESILQEQQLVGDMVRALQNGEFEPWFQPQYNHATGELIGAEALVRWRKNGKIIMPGDFVPLFEKNGFIYEVDQSVWRQVCALLRRWLDEGKNPLPVSVNISRHDMFQENFVGVLTGLLEEYELPAELLRLEITESAFSAATSVITDIAGRLINAGFTVEIDDFGSGYSSLNTLKDVPASILKLDMRFFETTENSARGGNIVEAIVRMAKWLGMAVIAEGVEERKQADYLKSIGCYYIQGYYYSKPLPVDEYEKRMQQGISERSLSRLETLETLDSDLFWDPKSMETLIFNSYVGGACIFEFCAGKAELLRYNDQYISELRGLIPDNAVIQDVNIEPFIDQESKKELLDSLQQALSSGKQASCVVRLTKGEQTEYVRQTSRVIAKTTDRALYYGVIQNLTEQRRLERERAESAERLSVIMNAMTSGMTAVTVKGGIKFLFANDRYYQLHGIEEKDSEQDILHDAFSMIHPDDRERVRSIVKSTTDIGQSSETVYRVALYGDTTRYLKMELTVTNLTGVDGPVRVAIYTDITDEKTASEQVRFLNESAGEILAQPDSEKAINDTLKKLLQYFNGERSYIFELDDAAQTSNNTYEVCSSGIKSEIGRLQGVPYDTQQYWFDAFDKAGFVAIPDVAAIEESESAMRELLAAQNIRSIIVAPLWRDDRLIGYIGVDNPTKAVEQVSQLIALSDYVAVLLTRRDLMKAVEHERQTAQQLMDDTPGGFVRMELFEDRNPTIVTVNNGFCEMLGMTRDEVMQAYGEDVFACLTDDDAAIAPDRITEAYLSGVQYTSTCKLRRKDGDLLWVMLFERFVQGENGSLYLNAYFTDISQRRSIEQLQSELLENLPSGAALFEFDGEKISVIHINRHYRKLINRSVLKAEEISVLGLFHPEDREMVMDELKASIRQGRNAVCIARILCDDSSYKPFSIATNNVREKDGCYLLYAMFTLISEEEHAIQKMLPVALSTIVSNTDAMSYVKDKELRYVCVSQSVADMAGGKTPREFIGKTAAEAFDAEFAAQFDKDDRLILESGKPVLRALEHIPSKDGSVRLARTTKFPILDASDNAIGVYCVSYDITAQKEKESQLELLTDTIPGGIAAYSVSKEGLKTLYFNDGYYNYSGYTREEYVELTEKEPLSLMLAEDRQSMLNMVRAVIAAKKDGMTGTCTYRCRTKSGDIRWMSMKVALSQVSEDAYMLNAVQLDITERMDSEKRQIELLDNLPFGAALYEYDGKTLTAIHLNRRYIELVNRKVDISTDGYSLNDAIHPDDRKRVFDELRSAIAEKRNAVCDIRVLHGENEYLMFHIDARIVPEESGKYLLYAAYELITDKEQELKITTERLKLLSDSIPGGIATFRCMPGDIEPIYFNDGVCHLTGYTREEFDNSSVSVLGLIFDEDKPVIKRQIELLMSGQTALDYTVRIHTKSGAYKWVECMASETGQESENVFLISAVLTDVTEQQEERERLRVSEELNRLAIDQSGKIISRYDVAARTLTLPYTIPERFNVPRVLENMPEEQVRLGRIAPETAEAYCGVFRRIGRGEASGEAVYQQNSTEGWRWLKSQFTTVFASDGKPVSAVISFEDITEQREKEAIYSRWQNAMSEKAEDSYTIVRCNMNKSKVLDSWEGSLLRERFDDPEQSFNSRTAAYTERFVYAEDRRAFRAFLNSDTMLAEYHRGHRSDCIDYREQNEDGSVRWLRLSVDLVEYPDSTDVEAYMLFENIDEQKHAELTTIRRAETDPLTGVLNRATFAQRVDRLIESFGEQTHHALFMLDVDGFKQVNDIFGHGAGDQTLIEISDALTRFCRKDDLVGRLGGDEFFAFISDIEDAQTAARKAQQLCDMTRKSLSADVHISISIGIALCPQDGDGFEALYKAADDALYRTKDAGKDGYSFSSGEAVTGAGTWRSGNSSATQQAKKQRQRPRRILIVDDNKVTQTMLKAILKDEYSIETAKDSAAALTTLQHYGTAISAVLLDLMMPGMSGFDVLEKLQQDERTRTIPVIIVTADEERETALRVIRAGASDLITKPVDAELLRVRVQSAISKSENERLRAQNSYLAIRNTEVNSYRAALERTGTMVVLLDWAGNAFSYSPSISQKLAGRYDERTLWSILLTDKVTDEQTVEKMRRLVQEMVGDRERTEGSLRVRLKTSSGLFDIFQLDVFRVPDDYGLAPKLIMTLRETAPEREGA